MPCKKCGSKSLSRDDQTGNLVCDSCGTLQGYDNYDVRCAPVSSGPSGVLIKVGTSGTGGSLNSHDKKIYEAEKLIKDLSFNLNLAETKVREVKSMICRITEGEYGQGDWFPILIGACAYVVMRNDSKALSMEEIGNLVGCDVYELGRMIMRVVDHLEIKLREFDIVGSFERVVRNLSCLSQIDRDKVDRIRKQGVFFIQCSMKWSLTTGRKPLPIVVAVLVLVAELNGVEDVTIEWVAKEVHASVCTCRLRYKELLETLVKVAKVLPWGKDVTVKNVVKNAPFVIRYMEMKSMAKSGGEGASLESVGLDLGEAVNNCLKKDFWSAVEEDSMEYDCDSRYFQMEDRSKSEEMTGDGVDKLQLSHECLSMVYDKFLKESGHRGKSVEDVVMAPRGNRMRGFDFDATDWWNGKSELSKRLMLKQILEKDVGFDAMPPAFVKGLQATKRRKSKIKAAKLRISRIMHPWNIDSCNGGDVCFLEDSHVGKKQRKRKRQVSEIDWEDFIIETLLLHQVEEEEIEKGHYNTLLDLHVFNSGVF